MMQHPLFVCLVTMSCCLAMADEPFQVRDIGARRELFVDQFLIERLDNAAFKLHELAKMPRPQSPLTCNDQPVFETMRRRFGTQALQTKILTHPEGC